MEKQGIERNNIKSKSFTTGVLNTDYYLHVRLKDDPGFEYEYLYEPESLFSSKNCYFRLVIYDDKSNGSYSVDDENVPKYLPIKKNLE